MIVFVIPFFLGIRTDKNAEDVVREEASQGFKVAGSQTKSPAADELLIRTVIYRPSMRRYTKR